MIKNRYAIAFAVLITASSWGVVSAQAQDEKTLSGKYCEKFIHLTEAPKAVNEECQPPAFIRKRDLTCVKETKANDYLQLREKEDGTLDFAFSLWFPPHTHYCSIIGNAQPDKDGWVYQNNMASSNELSRCILHIKDDKENNRISITNDPDATCRAMCGFHTNLAFLHFPKSLKKADKPDQHAFDYRYYMAAPANGGATCQETAKKYPDHTLVEKYIPLKPKRSWEK